MQPSRVNRVGSHVGSSAAPAGKPARTISAPGEAVTSAEPCMRDGHPLAVAIAVCALLPCIIFSGQTSPRPNKNLAGGIRLYNPHDMKLLVTIAVYISPRRGGD